MPRSKNLGHVWDTFVVPDVRFDYVPDVLPVACSVDGTGLRTRLKGKRRRNAKNTKWIDDNYFGKKGVFAYNLEGWSVHGHIPIAIRGPCPGTWSDMKIVKKMTAKDREVTSPRRRTRLPATLQWSSLAMRMICMIQTKEKGQTGQLQRRSSILSYQDEKNRVRTVTLLS